VVLLLAGCQGVPNPNADQSWLGSTSAAAPSPSSWSANVSSALPLATVGSRGSSLKHFEQATYNLVESLQEHEAELAWRLDYARYVRSDRSQASKRLALTFDDGPHPGYTMRIIELLRKLNVKATFFLVGRQAQMYPDLVKALVADGHNLGNHTYRHSHMTDISKRDQEREITTCGEVIRDITGKAPHLFRPPGGHYNVQVGRLVADLGYRVILWTDNSGDYSSPGQDVIERRILRHTEDGDIILFHDGIDQTIEVLPEIINTLRGKGYRFVTIDEMINYH
jgi:polysaccharide deacetylase family sporulation protein PdaB